MWSTPDVAKNALQNQPENIPTIYPRPKTLFNHSLLRISTFGHSLLLTAILPPFLRRLLLVIWKHSKQIIQRHVQLRTFGLTVHNMNEKILHRNVPIKFLTFFI